MSVIVYAPLDAVKLAQAHPDREVVFFAIGFETTAPANALAVTRAAGARRQELLRAGVAGAGAARHRRRAAVSRQSRVQGFSAPGTSAPSWARANTTPSPALPGAHRDHGLRAGRPSRWRAPNGAAPRGGRGRRGEPVLAGRQPRRAIPRLASSSGRSSTCATDSGAASAAFPRAACGSAGSCASSTPSTASRWGRWRPSSPRPASAARFCAASRSPTTARPSARRAPPSTPSAPPWSRPKAPAPRTTRTGGTRAGDSGEGGHPPKGARERRGQGAVLPRRRPTGSRPSSASWRSASRWRAPLLMGNGGSATDAQHVAVEFFHPIIEKRQAAAGPGAHRRPGAAHRHLQRSRLREGVRRSAPRPGASRATWRSP